jgi:hypothetical protein
MSNLTKLPDSTDQYLSDPKVLVIDSSESVQKQTVARGQAGPTAISTLLLPVILLAFDVDPAPLAAVFCATLMLVARVLTLPNFIEASIGINAP